MGRTRGPSRRTTPVFGAPVSHDSAIDLTVAYDASATVAEGSGGVSLLPLAQITEAHHDIFVGAYCDDRDVLHAAFNPGVQQSEWIPILRTAVGTTPLVFEECPVRYSDLRHVSVELEDRGWAEDAASIPFASDIAPASCSVRMTTGQLTTHQEEQLADAYGSLVTLDESGTPTTAG